MNRRQLFGASAGAVVACSGVRATHANATPFRFHKGVDIIPNGTGGIHSQLVKFRVTPSERVSLRAPKLPPLSEP